MHWTGWTDESPGPNYASAGRGHKWVEYMGQHMARNLVVFAHTMRDVLAKITPLPHTSRLLRAPRGQSREPNPFTKADPPRSRRSVSQLRDTRRSRNPLLYSPDRGEDLFRRRIQGWCTQGGAGEAIGVELLDV